MIGIVYGAIVAAMQPDLKRLVAYSSIAHLGFVVLGTFALTTQGIQGGLFTMVSHGLTTGALFLLVGMLYDRRHTRLDRRLRRALEVGAGARRACSSPRRSRRSACPASPGFVGEFLALLGTFLTHRWYAVVATTGVIFAAVYLLWAVQRAFTGEPEGENVGTARHHRPRARARSCRCSALSLFLGFYPKPVLDRREARGRRPRRPRAADHRTTTRRRRDVRPDDGTVTP